MIEYEEYTLETVDNYNYFTTSFSYSDLKVNNKKQQVNIIVDGLLVDEYDISLGLNALGNVATNVSFDHKITGIVLICVYNFIKERGTEYVVQHNNEYNLLHDFISKDNAQKHFTHYFLNGKSHAGNTVSTNLNIDMPAKYHYVDIIKHKGYPKQSSNDFDFYWHGLDFETNFFVDDNDYTQVDWKQYEHQFLDEESDKTVSLIPKENKPGELPVRQYTLSMLKEQEESKSTIRIKREYPDIDVFILLLGGSKVEESIYKHFPKAKIIKDKYFSGAIKNAIEQSTTEHFITVEANFKVYDSWRGYKRNDVFEETDVEVLEGDNQKRLARIFWKGPHIWCSGQGLHRGMVLWPKNYLKTFDVSDTQLEQFELPEIKMMPDAAGEFNENYEIFIIAPDNYYVDNVEKLKTRLPSAKVINGITQDECYRKVLDTVSSEYFWCINSDADLLDEFQLQYTPDLFRRNHVHVWQKLNPVTKLPYIYDGVKLVPKNYAMAVKDTDTNGNNYSKNTFGKLQNVKRARASKDVPFDVVMLSYYEPNADENFERLLKVIPNAKRVDRVKGILNAHKQAAMIADTHMVYVVDGDAQLTPNFKFEYYPDIWENDIVHVWRSKNPVNNLIYGYGGVKLFPTQPLRDATKWNVDFTTSISTKFKAVQVISNITAFNTDEWNTWKAAFRECAKLSSNIIERGKNDENEKRLEAWKTVGSDREFGEYAIRGAHAGMEYGLSCGPDELKNINDFDWLKDRFDAEI